MQNNQTEQLQDKLFDSDVIDIAQYVNTVKHYFWRISGVAFFLTILAGLFTVSLTPEYSSKVSIVIEAEQANISSIEEIYGLDSSRKEYFATQTEILKSRQIATRVVEQMQLQENEHFNRDIILANKSGLSSFIDNAKAKLKSLLLFRPQKIESEPTFEQALYYRKAYAINLLMQRTSITPNE